MPPSETTRNPFRPFLVMLATAGTIVLNVMAATGGFNGVTPEEVSAAYPSILTPAGYAFSIWTLIYLGLSAFSIFQLLPANWERFGGIRTLYVASCVLNCGWVYFWLNGRIGICVVMIVALSVTLLIMIWQFRTPRTYWELWLTKNTFGLYAGWVTAAAIVNIFVYLSASGIALPSAAITTFGVIAILAAATIGALIAWRLSNYLFPLSVAWALTAIAVKQGGNTIIVVASALGVVASLIAALSFVINLSANKQLPENE